MNNYKKNKLEQLKGFCAVVECGNSINDAGKRLIISESSVSLQIASLERDLGFQLFDRVRNRLVLNKKGKIYYQKAKRILLILDDFYNGKIGIVKVSKVQILFKRIQIKIVDYKNNMIRKLKMMIIKITLLRFLTFIALFCSGTFVYLQQTNWFFDREMERLANPLLKDLMINNQYRIDKSDICPFTGMQMHLDINDLFIGLIKKGYNNKINIITISECPSMPMRMNGTNLDNQINNPNVIKCDTERRFIAQKKRYKDENFILQSNIE
ncbi:MAG: hypothetical protein RL208_724, partial [Pseudomonadota bacterium]